MSAPVLSRATLSFRGRPGDLLRGSSEEYLVHQAVADLFGDRPDGDRGYLYRVVERRRNERDVLVLSREAPLPLEEVAFRPWLGITGLEHRPFDPALRTGQPLDFQVRVNATRVVTDPERTDARGRPKKQRFDVWDRVWGAEPETRRTPADVYGEWLTRQLAGAAEVRSVGVVGRGPLDISRGMDRDDEKTRRIRMVFAELTGRLVVEDAERLLETVVSGVGRGKAFGCGLMLLWPTGSLPRGAASPDGAGR